MNTRPDFGPAMLKLFLTIRTDAVLCPHHERACGKCRRKYQAAVRRNAGVSGRDMQAAVKGQLKDADKRVRLWGALGFVPAESGIRLTDDGGQEATT